MAYIFINRTTQRGNVEPRLSLSPSGRLQFNAAATRLLREKAVERVKIGWDRDKRRIALKVAEPKDTDAYTVNYATKGKGCGFAAKPVLRHIGFNGSGSASFLCEWNTKDKMLEVQLADGDKKK